MEKTTIDDVAKFFQELDSMREKKESLKPFYDKVAHNYDQVSDALGGQAVREKLVLQLKTLIGDKAIDDLHIIDVGAGTGYLGESLFNHGFKQIDSLEPSEVSQEVSKQKNIYSKYFNEFLLPTPTNGIPDNCYDVAVSRSSFVDGHISIEAVKELARMVKPGGIILFTLFDPKFTMNFMEVLSGFMKEKMLELLSMTFEPYKREHTKNMEYVNAYYIALKVL